MAAPVVVQQIRSTNSRLGILLYEEKLTIDDLTWFTKQELREIYCRSTRQEIVQKAHELMEKQ